MKLYILLAVLFLGALGGLWRVDHELTGWQRKTLRGSQDVPYGCLIARRRDADDVV